MFKKIGSFFGFCWIIIEGLIALIAFIIFLIFERRRFKKSKHLSIIDEENYEV